jgi:hypothetical protein
VGFPALKNTQIHAARFGSGNNGDAAGDLGNFAQFICFYARKI